MTRRNDGVDLVRGLAYGGDPPGTYRALHPEEVELHDRIVFAKTLQAAEDATAAWREHINTRRRANGLPDIPVAGVDGTVPPPNAQFGPLTGFRPERGL